MSGSLVAYFASEMTLEQLVDYTYGRGSITLVSSRAHVLLSELSLYVDYFRAQLAEVGTPLCSRPVASLARFADNLRAGVNHYRELLCSNANPFTEADAIELERLSGRLAGLAQKSSKQVESCAGSAA